MPKTAKPIVLYDGGMGHCSEANEEELVIISS